jgi:hypothetical protein
MDPRDFFRLYEFNVRRMQEHNLNLKNVALNKRKEVSNRSRQCMVEAISSGQRSLAGSGVSGKI